MLACGGVTAFYRDVLVWPCRTVERLELVLGMGKIPMCEAGYLPVPAAEAQGCSPWGQSSASHLPNRGLRAELPEPPQPVAKDGSAEIKLTGEVCGPALAVVLHCLAADAVLVFVLV